MDTCNIAADLPRLARERGEQVAMRCPGRDGRYDTTLTYAQLDARSDAIAAGLARRGIVRGTRTVVMVRPTPEFFLLMFALFKAGAVPVLVDPGHRQARAEAMPGRSRAGGFIGIPLAHIARVLLRWARSPRVCASPPVRARGSPTRRSPTSNATARTPARNSPTRSPTTSPRSCSPAAPPACRRAWCIAIAISSRRSACCAMRSASSQAASTCRRSRRSRCSIPRSVSPRSFPTWIPRARRARIRAGCCARSNVSA
jgi:hypothetical protein